MLKGKGSGRASEVSLGTTPRFVYKATKVIGLNVALPTPLPGKEARSDHGLPRTVPLSLSNDTPSLGRIWGKEIPTFVRMGVSTEYLTVHSRKQNSAEPICHTMPRNNDDVPCASDTSNNFRVPPLTEPFVSRLLFVILRRKTPDSLYTKPNS